MDPVYSNVRRDLVCPTPWCRKPLEHNGSIVFCQECGLAWDRMADQWVEVHGFVKNE
jgi:hypothetical protein